MDTLLDKQPEPNTRSVSRAASARGSVWALPPPTTPLGRARRQLYLLLNEPSSSTAAWVVSWVVVIAIVASTTTFVVSSTEWSRSSDWYPAFAADAEYTVVAIFTLEYLLRLLVHEKGSRLTFLVEPMNLIDLAAILPFYLELYLSSHPQLARGGGASGAGGVLRVMRVVRLMRLLRHSTELQLFAKAISKSAEGLKMLVVLVSVAVLIFSALLWYAERGVWVDEHVWEEEEERWNGAFVRSDGSVSPFPSIPSTFWWAVVTMTTVGYGDTFPVEAGGKVVATVAMFAGVLTLAMPITIIGTNFSEVYDEYKRKQAAKKAVSDAMLLHNTFGAGETLRELVALCEEEEEAVNQLFGRALATLDASDSEGADVARAQLESYQAMAQLGMTGLSKLMTSNTYLRAASGE